MTWQTQQIDWLDNQDNPLLSAGFPSEMVLLDCETTGGRASYHRITEVGLLVIENGQIIEQWQTLINPERQVPAGITRLTGITNAMVKSAPTFSEVADDLLEKLKGRVLVAHHARFDYGFLKREFERAGIKYNDKPLCSVKFSRLLYPQFNRHGLDHIIRRFKLSIENRHRAMDDAYMIYLFFLKSSQIHARDEIESVCQQLVKEHTLPSKIRRTDVDQLPTSPGVYYFYDDRDVLLYVGKSVNIKQRVLGHFSQDHKNHKDLKMSASIARIECDQTATDFGAQILESNQVKQLKPLYNSRLRRVRKLFRLSTQMHTTGYVFPVIKAIKIDDTDHLVQDSYGLFRSPKQAQRKLQKLADHFFLCHQILGIENTPVSNSNPCFRFQLKKCWGACCGKETYHEHNDRLMKALAGYQQKVWPWSGPILVEERSSVESVDRQFHLVNQWIYLQQINSEEQLYDLGYAMATNSSNDLSAQTSDQTENSEWLEPQERFDLDVYFILVRFLLDADKLQLNQIHIHQLQALSDFES